MALMNKLTVSVVVLSAVSYWFLVAPFDYKMDPPPVKYLAPHMNSRYALVTGASAGIGFSVAQSLCKRGFRNIVITGRNESTLEKAKGKLVNGPCDVVATWKLDLSMEPKTAEENFSLLFKTFDICLVIANASPEIFLPLEAVDFQISVNILNGGIINQMLLARKAFNVWSTGNTDGLFIMHSSFASFTNLMGGEVYGSTRAWQTDFFRRLEHRIRNADSNKIDFETTGKSTTAEIHFSVIETCVVATGSFQKAIENAISVGNPAIKQIQALAWDPDVFADEVLDKVLIQGLTFAPIGIVQRFMRFINNHQVTGPVDLSEPQWVKVAPYALEGSRRAKYKGERDDYVYPWNR